MSDDSDAAQAVGAWARGGPALREGQFQTMFKNGSNCPTIQACLDAYIKS